MAAGAVISRERGEQPTRDEFGRPTAPLSWPDLLAVSAYWLAITTLMGALSVIIIPRFVEASAQRTPVAEPRRWPPAPC